MKDKVWSVNDRNQVRGCSPVSEPHGPANGFRIRQTWPLSHKQCYPGLDSPGPWSGKGGTAQGRL